MLHASVAGWAEPGILDIGYNFNSLVSSRKAICDCSRLVWLIIVNKDDFNIFQILLEHTQNTCLEILFYVVERYNY